MVNKLAIVLVKKYYKLLIAIIISSSLSFFILFGLNNGVISTDVSVNNFIKAFHYPDITVTTELIDENIKDKISSIADIESCDSRLIIPVIGELEDGSIINLRLFTRSIKEIESTYIYEMNETDEFPNIMVDKELASNNNLKTGDHIYFNLDGKKEEFVIGSIVTTPDSISVVESAYIFGSDPKFGYVYFPEEYFLKTDFANKANQFSIHLESWADYDMVSNELENIFESNIISLSKFEDSAIKKSVDINIEPIYQLATVMSVFFFCVTTMIVYLFLTQIIRQSRKEIGILRALGFQKKKILAVFSRIILVVSILSCLLGLIGGELLLVLITNIFKDFFSLPYATYVHDIKIIILSFLITIISGQIAVFATANSISSISPKEALESEVGATAVNSNIITSLVKKLSSKNRYTVLSMLRNKKRFIISTLCCTVATVLILSSLSFEVSKNYLIDHMYSNRLKYEVEIFLKDEMPQKQLEELKESLGESVELAFFQADIQNENMVNQVNIVGYKNNDLFNIFDKDLNRLVLEDEDFIIESHDASTIGAENKDAITINDQKIKITKIANEDMGRFSYVNYETAKVISDDLQYVILANITNKEQFTDFVKNNDNILYISYLEDVKEGNAKLFKLYETGVYTLIFAAVLIGFIVIFNSNQTALFEQQKELSVLRTIGYQMKDISLIWMKQTFIQYILSLVIGFTFGTCFSIFGLSKLSSEIREYPFVFSIKMYLGTALIVLAYMIFSHFLMMSKIKKWNLVVNIKEKD